MASIFNLDFDDAEDMGYSPQFTRENEVILWRSVIIQAVRDAVLKNYGGMKKSLAERNKFEAQRWFYEAGPDFQRVCQYAELSPAIVQHAVLDFLTSPNPNPELLKGL